LVNSVLAEDLSKSKLNHGKFDLSLTFISLCRFEIDLSVASTEHRTPLCTISNFIALVCNTDIHALSIQAKTPSQWQSDNSVAATPNCGGGDGSLPPRNSKPTNDA
jgi:hypothetical protein